MRKTWFFFLALVAILLCCVLSISAQDLLYSKNYVFGKDTIKYWRYDGLYVTLKFPGGKILNTQNYFRTGAYAMFLSDIVQVNDSSFAVFSATNGFTRVSIMNRNGKIIQELEMPEGGRISDGPIKCVVVDSCNQETITVYPAVDIDGEDNFPGVFLFYSNTRVFVFCQVPIYEEHVVKGTPVGITEENGIFTVDHYPGLTDQRSQTKFILEKNQNGLYCVKYIKH